MKIRRWLWLAAAVWLFAGAAAAQPRIENYPIPENVINAPIKTFDDAATFKLADYKGKTLVLAFWAFWCEPCGWMTDEMARLQKEYPSQTFAVAAISLRYPKFEIDEARDYVREAKFPFPLGWINNEVGTLLRADHAEVPNILIISPGGVLVTRFVGFNPEETPAKLREAIAQVMKKPPS